MFAHVRGAYPLLQIALRQSLWDPRDGARLSRETWCAAWRLGPVSTYHQCQRAWARDAATRLVADTLPYQFVSR